MPGAATSVHTTLVAQGSPAQPSVSVQVTPSPSVPDGQAPQVKPVPGAATRCGVALKRWHKQHDMA